MDLVEEINQFYYRMALYELRAMNGGDCFDGLSYNSILYLNVIELLPECTVSRLSEALSITKSAATIKVNELVRQGLVVKSQSETDRRVYYLTLAPGIARAVGMYDRVFAGIGNRLRDRFDREQLETFRAVLHAVSEYDWKDIYDTDT